MTYMASQTAIVSTKGQFVIPADIREALHIKPGTRLSIVREGNHIVLRPVDKKFIDELCGITAGGPSMTEMLLKDRRNDEKSLKW